MVPLLLLAAITVISNGQPTGQPPKDECCDTKTVGGVTYTLAGRMDTRAYECLNPCIYQIEGEAGAKFCFAVGDMKVECNDEGMEVSERPPMGGSERPPMEGSERPPIEGSERPPMEGSERPPLEGSERPPMEGSERPPMEGSERPPMEGSEKPPMEGSEKPTQGGGEVTSVPKPAGVTEVTEGPTGPTIPNPGSAASELTLSISQTWAQEPSGYERTAVLTVPATTAGQKVPVVFHLHGNGGQGNTRPVGDWLGEECIIVAPNGYERSWNVYTEKSKADDVGFIIDLIAKIGAEIPAADMNNVNIIGTSNGAALTYSLIIQTGADRPFRRAFPMVSSLISPQYHDNAFWKPTVSAAAGEANTHDISVVPEFAAQFEYAHFHGTEDGALKYDGQSPGPSFLGGADVLSAQLTDFLWAKAMGYTGDQITDSAGVSIGTDAKPVEEYKYLDGRVRHYKLIGEGHSTGPGHVIVQETVKAMIFA